MFHASLIILYKETLAHGPNFEQPLPNLIEGKEEYKVEEILESGVHGVIWGKRSVHHDGLTVLRADYDGLYDVVDNEEEIAVVAAVAGGCGGGG